jgi:hypothetical protein
LIEPTRAPAPDRPASIELAAAVMLVAGAFGLAQTLFGDVSIAGSAGLASPIVTIALTLDVLSIVTGALIRTGRWWTVCLNVAAVFAFLYLAAFPDPVAIVLGLSQAVVVAVLLRQRAWFDAMAASRRPETPER